MKKTITGAIAVALLTVAGSSPVHAGWGVTSNLTNNMNKSYDNSKRSGRDMNTSVTANRTDNRDYSDRSSRIDSRNMSDNRSTSTSTVTTTSDSHNDNRVDNQRHQSHNYGDGSIVINGEGYKPRVGHENASIGGVSGTNNYVDNSVSGNFGIGHSGKQ